VNFYIHQWHIDKGLMPNTVAGPWRILTVLPYSPESPAPTPEQYSILMWQIISQYTFTVKENFTEIEIPHAYFN
jgi:hypothetical protein